MSPDFRFAPAAPRDSTIFRAGLVQRLAGRFERRLTTVTAPAGAGKTTTLSLAVANNRLDEVGRDVWLGLTTADRSPVHLLSALAGAFDVALSDDDATLAHISEAVWGDAPTEIAVILDDAHVLIGSPSMDLIVRLIDALPNNGHVVLASREPLPIHVARLAAHDQLLILDGVDLELDDEERRALIERRQSTGSIADVDLPRHAATADLRLAAGPDASADFVWEEILSQLDPERLLHLGRLAVLDEVDDVMAEALTDGAFTATAAFERMPLVERSERGVHRAHALLREALISRTAATELNKSRSRAAEIEAGRHCWAAAVRLFDEAGDRISAIETARRFAISDNLLQSAEDAVEILRILGRIDAPESVRWIVHTIAVRLIPGSGYEAALATAATAAHDAGDADIETSALVRLVQCYFQDDAEPPEELTSRLADLAEHLPRAVAKHAHVLTMQRMKAGRPDEVLALLPRYDHLPEPDATVLRWERLCNIGRFEQVEPTAEIADLDHAPAGLQTYLSYAMWLRGVASPELAKPFVEESIPGVIRRGFAPELVNMLEVGVSIAIAAGDIALARRWALQAVETARPIARRRLSICGPQGLAAVALAEGDEDTARKHLHECLALVPLGNWPAPSYLTAIISFSVLVPETRAAFLAFDLGPTLTMVQQAAAALIAGRRNDPEGDETATKSAASLPWNEPNLLRVHVPPTLLAELGCIAAAHGSTAAWDLVTGLPDHRRLLAVVARNGGAVAHQVALAELDHEPTEALVGLRVGLLGAPWIERSGHPETHADWRRTKVRELFALLALRGPTTRRDVIGLMWPDHEDDQKAQNLLRTTLRQLNGVLEPDRGDNDPTAVRTVGDSLVLASEIEFDVRMFEQLVEEARSDEAAGLTSRAFERYQAAADQYGGDVLDDVDAAWIVLEQVRLRSLAVNATCRVAELFAAKGEPEMSALWARRACDLDPASERAMRLLALALDASGDRVAARRVLDALRRHLAEFRLEPDRSTRRLLDRIT